MDQSPRLAGLRQVAVAAEGYCTGVRRGGGEDDQCTFLGDILRESMVRMVNRSRWTLIGGCWT